jgi:hypothetical protein
MELLPISPPLPPPPLLLLLLLLLLLMNSLLQGVTSGFNAT